MTMRTVLHGLSLVLIMASLTACQQRTTTQTPVKPVASGRKPDYNRQLPPGASALRRIDNDADWPDIADAWRSRDPLLYQAMERSIGWFGNASTKQFFPFEHVSHDHARRSIEVMLQLMESSATEREFTRAVQQQFDVYESVGWDGSGTVLFTGYYAPILKASPIRTGQYTAPLYTRPADLATDPKTGQPLGRKTSSGRIVPYETRAEIERSNKFAGNELVWLQDDLDAYIVHVNGSAKLRMTDGSSMYVGYAGKTDQPYASLGRAMIKEGLVESDGISLKKIRDVYRKRPDDVRRLMNENASYVFFQEYGEGNWPAGSLGFPVSDKRSIATDKSIYPRAGVVLVDTKAVTFSGGQQSFNEFMLDQDTGGAINAPGRTDIFMGVGPMAEIIAGAQYAEGQLYYFFLKPQYMD